MKTIVKILNYILIRLFNYAIFTKFSKEILNEKKNKFETIEAYYCGYWKNYKLDDWRFSENQNRKNVKYIKIQLLKFI